MEITNGKTNFSNITYTPTGEQSSTRTFLANVFLLMFIALGVSALVAWQFSINANLLSYLITPTGLTGLGMATIFAPLGFCAYYVFWIQETFSIRTYGLVYSVCNHQWYQL